MRRNNQKVLWKEHLKIEIKIKKNEKTKEMTTKPNEKVGWSEKKYKRVVNSIKWKISNQAWEEKKKLLIW